MFETRSLSRCFVDPDADDQDRNGHGDLASRAHRSISVLELVATLDPALSVAAVVALDPGEVVNPAIPGLDVRSQGALDRDAHRLGDHSLGQLVCWVRLGATFQAATGLVALRSREVSGVLDRDSRRCRQGALDRVAAVGRVALDRDAAVGRVALDQDDRRRQERLDEWVCQGIRRRPVKEVRSNTRFRL